MPLSTGEILNNRYRIVKLMGEGGFGAVYRAWDTNMDSPVAIKESLDTSPAAQKQFHLEAKLLFKMRHPNLPRVFDHFDIPGQGQYLVMEYVDGEDVQSIMDSQQGPLPFNQTVAWIQQICDALTYLHNQNPPVIHRDVKPANIRITSQNQAMLVDFGIAKIYDPSRKTTIGAQAVTPGYSPPEQYGKGITDAQSDVYSLGATTYHMLTGILPPAAMDIMAGLASPPSLAYELNEEIPLQVSQAIEHAMQPKRSDRIHNIDDFKEEAGLNQLVNIQVTRGNPALVEAQIPQSSAGTMQLSQPVGKSKSPVLPLLVRKLLPILLLIFILVIVVITAWPKLEARIHTLLVQDQPTPTFQLATATIKPITSTPSSTYTPAPTETATLTLVPTLQLPVSFGTALPKPAAIISSLNVDEIIPLAKLAPSHNFAPDYSDLAWSPDGKYLGIAVDDRGYVFSTGLNQISTARVSDWTEQIFFVNDSKRFVLTQAEGPASVFDISSNTRLLSINLPTGWVGAPNIQVVPTRAEIMYMGEGDLYSYSIDDGTQIKIIRRIGNVWSSACSSDGNFLALGLNNGNVVIRSLVQNLSSSYYYGLNNGITNIALSPDGSVIAALSPREGKLLLWRVVDKILLFTINQTPLPEAKQHIRLGLTFSPDGKLLVVGWNDGFLRIYSTEDGSELAKLSSNTKAVVFSPDQNYLAAAGSVEVTIWGLHP